MLMALQFVGVLGASMIIKEWIDRVGLRPFFMLSNLATILFQIYWVLMIVFPGRIESALPLVYLLIGVALASFSSATNKYLSLVCRPSERALSVTLFSTVVGFTGGLTSTGWGFILKDSATGLMNTNAFLVYFVSAFMLQVFLLKGYMKIKDNLRSEEPLPTNGIMVRPFRYLVTFINMVEPPVSRNPQKSIKETKL
jgi:hypothetical protein